MGIYVQALWGRLASTIPTPGDIVSRVLSVSTGRQNIFARELTAALSRRLT